MFVFFNKEKKDKNTFSGHLNKLEKEQNKLKESKNSQIVF